MLEGCLTRPSGLNTVITFDQFYKNVASVVILYVHKMAKMSMFVIAFQDLKFKRLALNLKGSRRLLLLLTLFFPFTLSIA